MQQEVKQVGGVSHLIGCEPFAKGTGFFFILAETHRCGSSVQNDLAKEGENAEKKRTAFGEEAK